MWRSHGPQHFPNDAPDQSAMTGLEGQPLCRLVIKNRTKRKP
jgi:hypothetical protein